LRQPLGFMEAESISSLSPLIEQADEWGEVLLLLPLLVALEAVLSADNAIALAAISRRLTDPARQRQALNLGLALALVFRLLLIVAAQWVLNFWPLQAAAALYLLWLSYTGLTPKASDDGDNTEAEATPTPVADQLRSVVLTLGVTDLAFSLDSVAAAVAVSDRIWLVMVGGAIGVLALRLTAGLFIRWLEIYPRLEPAGYLAVGLVGVRLVVRLVDENLVPPEWVLFLLVALLFVWGFSKRTVEADTTAPPTP
jgi:YkoY family integral membrane protein